jgi:hypothetical protein
VRKVRYDLTSDYRIKPGQALTLDLAHEDIARWCANYGTDSLYAPGTGCVVATGSGEDKFDAGYRIKPTEDLSLKFGYAYANRATSYNLNARAAFVGTNGGLVAPATVAAGSMAGLNAGDFQGFHSFFEESRIENAVKASANWQATDKLSVTLSGKVADDVYPTSYGVTAGSNWSADVDVGYVYSDNTAFTGYVTQQHRERNMTDIAKAAAGSATTTAIATPAWATWSNNLKDDNLSVGINAKHSGMLGGKLDLAADLSYTLSNTVYGTSLNYSTVSLVNPTTGGVLTCSSPLIESCGNLPTIVSEITELKLTGTYRADKKSTVVARYVYQQLNANDYSYGSMQLNTAGVAVGGPNPSNVLATGQQVGTYTVNVFTLAYVYTF